MRDDRPMEAPAPQPTTPPHVAPSHFRTHWGSLLGKPAGIGFCPTVIHAGDTFVVPEGFQVLYVIPIDVQGTLQVDGDLIPVS